MNTLALTARHNGVYRGLQGDFSAAPSALQHVEADLRRVRGGVAVPGALARALDFPATFGGNWDALNDALQDLSWLPPRGVVLTLRGADGIARSAPEDFALLREILESAATYWGGRGRVFVAFCDVPSLPEFPRR